MRKYSRDIIPRPDRPRARDIFPEASLISWQETDWAPPTKIWEEMFNLLRQSTDEMLILRGAATLAIIFPERTTELVALCPDQAWIQHQITRGLESLSDDDNEFDDINTSSLDVAIVCINSSAQFWPEATKIFGTEQLWRSAQAEIGYYKRVLETGGAEAINISLVFDYSCNLYTIFPDRKDQLDIMSLDFQELISVAILRESDKIEHPEIILSCLKILDIQLRPEVMVRLEVLAMEQGSRMMKFLQEQETHSDEADEILGNLNLLSEVVIGMRVASGEALRLTRPGHREFTSTAAEVAVQLPDRQSL